MTRLTKPKQTSHVFMYLTTPNDAHTNNHALFEKLQVTQRPNPPGTKIGTKRKSPMVIMVCICLITALMLWCFVSMPTSQLTVANVTEPQSPATQAQITPIATGDTNAPKAVTQQAEQSVNLQATGYVVARRTATVGARATAAVREIYVSEGSFVQEGALLAQLDDHLKDAQYQLAVSEYKVAQSQISEIRTQLEEAELAHQRMSQLAMRELISRAELDQATKQLEHMTARFASVKQHAVSAQRRVEVMKTELEHYAIRAPFAGIVTERSAQPGEIVSPMSAGGGFTRTGIATVVDMESLEVEVEVNEAAIRHVREEQAVQIKLNAYPERHYPGQVLAIIPTADRNTATIRVRIKFNDLDSYVLPDMGVRVDFIQP